MTDLTIPQTKSNACTKSIMYHLGAMRLSLKPNEDVGIHCAGAFGVLAVANVTAEEPDPDFICIYVKKEDGTQMRVVAHISQCAFMFSVIPKDGGKQPVI
ncbi:MAG: hypothetical protein DVB32_09935 [Verrucomicrobia bacterium]|nr:MAG: hypothetical protein DVB32_09935 [Verrucomicrobiota bacterium]